MKLNIPQLKASTITDDFNTTTDLRRELTRLTNRYLKQEVLPLNTIDEFILAIDSYIDKHNAGMFCHMYFCLHAHNLKWASVIEANTYTIISDYFEYILNSPRFRHTTFFLLAKDFSLTPVEFRATVILPVIKLALQKHLAKRTAP